MMSVSDWISRTFNLHPKPEAKTERVDLVRETYDKVSEVRKLREDVLENRDFPIAGFLRDEPMPRPNTRRRKRGQS